MLALTISILLMSYICLNLLKVAHKNKKAFKFFKEHEVHFPVLKNPGIFGGHLSEIYAKKNWKNIDDFHRQYGPTFGYYWVDQPWVSTKDLDLLKMVYFDQSTKHLDRPKLGTPFDDWNNSILGTNGEPWRRNRLPITASIRKNAVRSEEFSKDIKSIVDQVKEILDGKLEKAEKLNGKKELELNVDDFYQRYTGAVIYLVGYKQKNVIDFDSEKEKVIEMIREGVEAVPNIFFSTSMKFEAVRSPLRFLGKFQKIGKFIVETKKHLLEHVRMSELAKDRKKIIQEMQTDIPGEEKYNRRILDVMADELILKNIKQEEFLGNMLFMLIAGILTTADTLTCCSWFLAQHPDIQERLRTTLREEGMDADYVTWFIHETLRRHPAVPLFSGRVLTEDVTVNGKVYPKGCVITPSIYSIHHDPNIWPEPEVFNPDRWRGRENIHPNAFMAFGSGPRSCPGAHLAVQEIRIILKMLLANYRFEKCPRTVDKLDFSAPGLAYCFMDNSIIVKLVPL